MPDATLVDGIYQKWTSLVDDLDERGRRRWAATEAIAIGRSGVAAVAEATGLSDRTVRSGITEIRADLQLPPGHQRRRGAGRKPLEVHQPNLIDAVERLVEPTERGDPQSPLRWTCKSIANPVSELRDQGTAEFSLQAIRRWWKELGSQRYRKPTRLLITADCGGSNGHRNRLWKLQLQSLADEMGMVIEVCHYHPGTSKWNKVEHRLFCHITRNWRGVPLQTHEVLVNLVSSTRTQEELEVHCWLDETEYFIGRKVSDDEFAKIRIGRNSFHGDWNYEIQPSTKATIR